MGCARDDQWRWVARKCVLAVTQGSGPFWQSFVCHLQLMSMRLPGDPPVNGAPVGSRAVSAAGCFFLVREIELSLAVAGNRLQY